jgi:predicted ArsR family transcriptional regulator
MMEDKEQSRNERVLVLLRTRGALTPFQIAAALALTGEQVRNTLSSLQRAKKIRRVARAHRPPVGMLGGPKSTSVWALPEQPRTRRRSK